MIGILTVDRQIGVQVHRHMINISKPLQTKLCRHFYNKEKSRQLLDPWGIAFRLFNSLTQTM